MNRVLQPWWLIGAIMVVYVLAPLGLVVLFAFTNRAITNFPIDYVSLQWWREMFAHPQFWRCRWSPSSSRSGSGSAFSP